MKWLLCGYALMSAVTFTVYWMDKRFARGGGRRIPEKTLHLLSLAGGWPGALVAQRILRHKNRKVGFQIIFWLTVTLHVGLWASLGIRGR